ncbi:phosphocholine cytidylyltransferase family protein [Chitinasiproducens palmae]|uniref:Choline kinase n=1 Tax=Chitinasiproducens palmae TaxID=1770053 RepID=A0A1H2PSD7_9BURK|nr:phosphocholine cytidylyltransferase family protein [Chitinasiproducens palmae]SDV49862.1 Choline kinase [Chitinasiproducens palmae]
MRAIILAAGVGQRLQQAADARFPKCLLRFGGHTLLERHLTMLRSAGIDDVVLGVGFAHEAIEAELARLNWQPRPTLVVNPDYTLGSVLTVHTLAAAMQADDDVLLFDADVLYDERIIAALVQGSHANRLLIDRDFEAGDEPVKLCVRDGVPVELRKRVAADVVYDTVGESIGFFRFDQPTARRLVEIVAGYIDAGRSDQPHEEAVRDLLIERGEQFDVADATGLPWLEIDFPVDVARAADEVLPQLLPFPPALPASSASPAAAVQHGTMSA